MSKVTEELNKLILNLNGDSECLYADMTFPSDFIGFEGHFPGNKILPGFIQVQCIIAILEKYHNKNYLIKEIQAARYKAPVFPNEKISFRLEIITADTIAVKAFVTSQTEKKSDIKIEISSKEKLVGTNLYL